MNAPDLVLPDNVGFRVGPGGFRHLVLEVHYLVRATPGRPGESGLVAHLRLPGPRQTHVRHSVRPGIHLPPRRERVDVHNTCRYVRRATFKGVRVSRPHPRLGREVYLERMTAGRASALPKPTPPRTPPRTPAPRRG